MNQVHRQPNFENILRVLRREIPQRPTLFEFFMNDALYESVAGPKPSGQGPLAELAWLAKAYAACGPPLLRVYAGNHRGYYLRHPI